ncbi:interleukin-2 receptor subunit beta-like isoform X2 [Anguilla rostrata]|uniref:interleukin-2 receptor subunit beta-like isoform X2 n=1 Tax=Anguilla rostrata TaxID=7938 RepID=UPI0030CD5006
MGPLRFSVYVLLLAQLHPSHSHQSLRCLNDYINNITCVWESGGVPPAAVCTLHGVSVGLWETTYSKCELKPLNKQDPSLRGCHLVFETKQFHGKSKIPIHVNCENVTDPVAQIQHYEPRLHIKMNPPGKPNITNYTISWSPGHPFSDILPDYAFQLQFKQKDQRWEDVDPVTILDKRTQEQLNEEALEKGKSYQVRVRVGVPPQDESYKGEWSHWGPTTSWRSEVGRELTREVTRPPADTMKEKERMLIVCGAVLLVFLVAISITLPIRLWVNKANCKPVPNPSKYFEVLNSIHGGNFQKWLSPVFSAQSFDVLQYSDNISHVEVFSAKDTSALFRKESAPASQPQGVSGQSPSFSNLSYFCSSYPYKVEMHPVCSGDQPAEGAAEEEGKDRPGVTSAGSIQMGSSYESLQTLIDRRGEPIHPDSGIGVGSEDQEDTEDEGEVVRKGTAIHSDPTAFLPFLCPFGKSPFHDPFPQHPSAFPHFPFPLPNKGAGRLVQPCSDEYMPVKEICSSSAGKCSEENTSK